MVFAWINDLKLKIRDRERRAYYALREAQALRMQYGTDAEAWCERQLAKPNVHQRRRRFLLLVQKALLTE